MKQCPHCNAELPDEANICLACFKAPKKSGIPIITKNSKAEKIIVFAAALFVFISAVGFSAVNSRNGLPKAEPDGNRHNSILNINTIQNHNNGNDIPNSDETVPGSELSGTVPSSEEVGSSTEPSSETAMAEESGTVRENENVSLAENPSNKVPEAPAVNPPSTSKPEISTQPPEPEYDNFEYAPYNNGTKYYSITKYTGNSRNVTIPAKIDGKYVVEIASDAFKSNSKIETISFVTDSGQPFLWIQNGCFNSLSSLHTISFPETDLGIVNKFAKSCTKLKQINITNRQYKFLDGGLYYYTSRDWKLRFYCPAYTGSTLTLPSWCAGIESSCNLDENPYLKVINMHADCTSFPSNYNTSKYLEAVNVDSANTRAFSKDGVLFCKDSNGNYSTSLYPPCKKDKVFKMPENVRLTVMSRAAANPYLEELWVPASSSFDSYDQIFFNSAFPNLKTIHLQNGHSLTDKAKSTFTGNLYFY